MKVSDLRNSRFLTQNDVDPPRVFTMKTVIKENVAPGGEPPKEKWVLKFHEPDSKEGLVLNNENGALIQSITGSDDSEDWAGKRITLFKDPTVRFAGKLVGGIRVRAAQDSLPADDTKDDVTW
jgi:hypothetical protein